MPSTEDLQRNHLPTHASLGLLRDANRTTNGFNYTSAYHASDQHKNKAPSRTIL